MTDRPDPLGKRALFEGGGADAEPRTGGRDAVFSAGPAHFGTASVECAECGTHSRVGWLDLSRRIAKFSLWFPWAEHSRWITCPACDRRTWCRVTWFE